MRLISCSFNNNTGESVFAANFIDYNIRNKLYIYDGYYVYLYYDKKIISKKPLPLININIHNQHLLQLYLTLVYIFNKKKFNGWLNYLPLWNSLLIFFLDNDKIIGPITGNRPGNNNISFNSYTRRYLIPFLYIISIFIIKLKKLEVISGNFYIKYKLQSYGITTYDFFLINKLIIGNYKIPAKHKIYDVIFYNSNNKIKNSLKTIEICLQLMKIIPNIRIACYGDPIDSNLKHIKSFGRLDQDNLFEVFSQTKFYITNSHEAAGLSAIEAELMGCKILCEPGSGAAFYTDDCIQLETINQFSNYIKNNL